jgi:hypothetical protein
LECHIYLQDTIFRVIVQQNPVIQTGFDKVIPVTCLVDLAEINVTADAIPGYVLNMRGIVESNVDTLLIKHNSTPKGIGGI